MFKYLLKQALKNYIMSYIKYPLLVYTISNYALHELQKINRYKQHGINKIKK